MSSFQRSKENGESDKEKILETGLQLQESYSEKIPILRRMRRGVQENPSFREF